MTRVLVWITEVTWRECVAETRPLLPADAAVVLLHLADAAGEAVVRGAPAGLLGRRPARVPAGLETASADEAQAVLAAAADALGRDAERLALRGRAEEAVVAASADADMLVVARDGTAPGGPKSLTPRTRFVVDHALCAVLLVPGGHPLHVHRPPPSRRGGGPPARPGGAPPRSGGPSLPSRER